MMAIIYTLNSQDEEYIVIKNKEVVSPRKEKKENNPAPMKKEDKKLQEVTDEEECQHYEIKEIYRCRTCMKDVAPEQKEYHNPSHQLEKVKIGERFVCQSCSRLFIGKFTYYCPVCKGKLKRDVIDIEEVTEGNETFFINNKTKKKICKTKPDIPGDQQKEGLAGNVEEPKR